MSNNNVQTLIDAAASQTAPIALRSGGGLYCVANEGAANMTAFKLQFTTAGPLVEVVDNGSSFVVNAGQARLVYLPDSQVEATVAGSTTIKISKIQDYD